MSYQPEHSPRHIGCLVCGKPILYETKASRRTCSICKGAHASNAVCEDGHFVCDHCHTAGSFTVMQFLLNAQERDPVKMFLQAVSLPDIYMHGPEHHSIVPGVLLAAYHNNGGDIPFAESIDDAVKRSSQVPSGICGFWGACGAAVGGGIYASIITGSNPLNEKMWSIPQLLTARCLEEIAKVGGPRCCKRTSRIAIETSVSFTREHLGISMPVKDAPCTFHEKNEECLHTRCPYFDPVGA